VLFVLTTLAVIGRFASRIHFRRRHNQRLRPGADDCFLLGSFLCLAVAVALQLRYIDQLYMTQALSFGSNSDARMPATPSNGCSRGARWSPCAPCCTP
jgi:hypothetical protein